LENPVDRGAWWATVLGHKKSDATERLTLSQVLRGLFLHRNGKIIQFYQALTMNMITEGQRRMVHAAGPIRRQKRKHGPQRFNASTTPHH